MSCIYQSTQESKELDLTSLQSKFDITTKLIKFYLFAVADPGFSRGGCANSKKVPLFFKFFAENCMKMKEFGPPGARPWPLPTYPGSANGLIWNVTMLAATRML